MMTLAMLAASASLLSGQSCAAISNTTNTAAWVTPGRAAVSTTYEDRGDSLYYTARVPLMGATKRAIVQAEDSLGIGASGPKLRVACSA